MSPPWFLIRNVADEFGKAVWSRVKKRWMLLINWAESLFFEAVIEL